MSVFHELFDVEENILATLPELDHYGIREKVRYWGPIYDSGEGAAPRWPEPEGKKIFVYLRPSSPSFAPFIELLRKAKLRTLWFAPGIAKESAAHLQTGSLTFTSTPLRICAVSASADVAILGAGHGTTAAMFLGRKPMLLAPRNTEQLLLARAVAAFGAAEVVSPSATREWLESQLLRSVGRTSADGQASTDAFQQKQQIVSIANRLEEFQRAFA
jgi:UDP:flavonoid glycosyltransferase YjiC (YdhE family)